MALRAVLYTRVSTDKQEAENQLIQLREYAKKQGYEVIREIVDVASGASTSRPGFDLVFDMAAKKQFDVLVFWDLSRFSRAGVIYTLNKLKQLENAGVEWESYREPYFRTVGPFRDAVLAILATLASIEREKIRERTRAGLERARREGKRIGRPPGSRDKKPRKRAGYYLRWQKGE